MKAFYSSNLCLDICVNACKKTVPKRYHARRKHATAKNRSERQTPPNVTFMYQESMQLLDMPQKLPDTSATIVFKTDSSYSIKILKMSPFASKVALGHMFTTDIDIKLKNLLLFFNQEVCKQRKK